MALVGIIFTLAHLFEHFVEFLKSVLAVGVSLYPLDEHVLALRVLFNSKSFKNAIERLLCIRLDDKLLMLHQFR